jgi:hypothetical protein
MVRIVALLVVLAAVVTAAGGGVASSAAATVECDSPGPWPESANGVWVRRVVEVAGYEIVGCTGSAWVAVTPVTSFYVWATEPWQRPTGMRAATEPYLRGAFTDGTRVVWEAQGLALWVDAGPNATDRLPGASAFGWLRTASRGLPRRYRPLEMMPTPPAALHACRSNPSLVPACPIRIPGLRLRTDDAGWRTYPNPVRRLDGIFGMQLGGEIPGRPELMRPPGNLHIEVEVRRGRTLGMRIAWPTGKLTPPRDGLVHEERSRPLLLARVTWGGKQGAVALAPGYPVGGSQGNHVVFRWRHRGKTYVVGMHAWEPFTEAYATMRRVVASLPR